MSMIFYVPRCRLKASTAVHCDAMAYFGRFMTVFGLTSYEWNDKEKGCLSHKKIGLTHSIIRALCFLTRNWLDQMTITNRIISSQALTIILSKRNTSQIKSLSCN